MTKRKKAVAEKTSAFAFAFAEHPLQDELLASAIALRAIALGQAANGPTTKAALEQKAKAEFACALQATIFPPSEDQFYCIWSRHPEAKHMAACINEVWASKPGTYGTLPPQHWHAKK